MGANLVTGPKVTFANMIDEFPHLGSGAATLAQMRQRAVTEKLIGSYKSVLEQLAGDGATTATEQVAAGMGPWASTSGRSGGLRGDHVDRLVHVPVGGRDADAGRRSLDHGPRRARSARC